MEMNQIEDVKSENVETESADDDVKNENSQSETDAQQKVDVGSEKSQVKSSKQKTDSNGQTRNAKRKKKRRTVDEIGEIWKNYKDYFIKITPEPRFRRKPFEYQCLKCNKKVTRHHVAKHVQREHNRDFYEQFFSITNTGHGQEFKCKVCEKKYINTDEYHVHSCDKNWNKKCEKCDLIMHGAQDFNMHIRRHTFKGYRCPKCNCRRRFKDTYDLRMHDFEKHTNRKFQCDYCLKFYQYRSSMKKHLMHQHNFMEYISKTKLQKKSICEWCGWSFFDQCQLRIHVETVHLNVRKFACKLCPKTFKLNKNLKEHNLIHAGVKFTCDVCSKSFGRKTTLAIHKKLHENETEEGLKDRETYKCQIENCGKEFLNRKSYNRHYRFHHKLDSSRHQCKYCFKFLYDSYTLARHIETHSGFKKFQCNRCLSKFTQKAGLDRHIKNQTCNRKLAVKKTKCTLCNRGVTDIKKHLEQHTSRPHKCPLCPNSFNIKGTMKRHITACHGEQSRLECDVCLKKYRGRHCLEKHRLRVHGIEKVKKENYDDIPAFEITKDNVYQLKKKKNIE